MFDAFGCGSITMLFGRLAQSALLAVAAVQNVAAYAVGGKPNAMFRPEMNKRALQDIVTYDQVRSTLEGPTAEA